jgi:uncharacterized membrane protein YhaH (DUF805 family)
MFKNPFSFKDRIRRSEYWLSLLIFYGYSFFVGFFIGFASVILGFSYSSGLGEVVMIILLIPGYWFMLAQGAKRCHDRGNIGWYQIIPFYALWMLLADGVNGVNEYGSNPKGIGNPEQSIESA